MACYNIAALFFLFTHAHAKYPGPRYLDGSPAAANDWTVKAHYGDVRIFGKTPDYWIAQKPEFNVRNVENPHSLVQALKTKFPGAEARSRFRGARESVIVRGVEKDDLKKFLIESGKVRGYKERAPYVPKEEPAAEEEAESAAEAEVAPALLTQASSESSDISKLAAGMIGFCVGSGIVHAVFRFRQGRSGTNEEALLAA